LIAGVLPPMSGSHPLVLSSFQPLYHCTSIPALHASPWPLGFLNAVNRQVVQ
jgi:hypothetical protein